MSRRAEAKMKKSFERTEMAWEQPGLRRILGFGSNQAGCEYAWYNLRMGDYRP